MTTASSVIPSPFTANRLLLATCGAFMVVWALSYIGAASRFDWLLENILVVALAALMAATYRRSQLSGLSYLSIFLFLVLHEWGAHYKYSDVPFGVWMMEWSGATRNHYDRVVHAAFGVCFAYPVREVIVLRGGARPGWAGWLTVAVITALGAGYELMEWLVAAIVSPEDGEAFVGMQGDVWDAQKDMVLASLGALPVLFIGSMVRRRRVAQGSR